MMNCQRPLLSVTAKTSAFEAMTIMTKYRVRHLPVLTPDQRCLLGMLSIGDAVKAVIDQEQEEIQHLTSYVNQISY